MFESRYCRSLYHTFIFLNAASPLKRCNADVCSAVTGPLSEPQIAYTCREMLQVRSLSDDFDTFVTEVSLLIICCRRDDDQRTNTHISSYFVPRVDG